MSATMLKPNTTSATVTRFDPLDRRWYDNTKKTKVSVPIGPTLRQMLKTLIRTAGQQEHDLRVRVVRAEDGLRIMLFGRGVHVEVGGLRHAGGTQITDELDADSPLGTRSLDELERLLPPAWRKGWAKHRYIESPESKRKTRVMGLAVRAMKDPISARRSSRWRNSTASRQKRPAREPEKK